MAVPAVEEECVADADDDVAADALSEEETLTLASTLSEGVTEEP